MFYYQYRESIIVAYYGTRHFYGLAGKSLSFKVELLSQYGIDFDSLPLWQRRGTGLYWEQYEKAGFNPVLNTNVIATRRRIKVDEELLVKEAYGAFIRNIADVYQMHSL